MYERELIWELFHQVILEMWQGGQGELSFSIEQKALIELSLAQCCEDQLIPINPAVKPSRFQRGISIAGVFAVSQEFTSRDCSANNPPLWQCTAWNTPTLCLGWWRKDPFVVLLPAAAAANCFFTFPKGFTCALSRGDVLELFLWVPWVPLDLLSLQSGLCVCCTQMPALDHET